jgi:hypothetical protein
VTDPSSWAPPAGGAQQQPGGWQQPQQAGGPQPGGWQPQAQQPPSGQWAQPQQAGWQQPQQPGGLMLHTKFSPLAFLLWFCSPKVSIDGSEPIATKWGEWPLPGVAPGRHHVRVWFRYMFYGTCGLAEATVDVPEQGLRLEYKAPTWFVFSKGRFENLAGQAMPAGAAYGAAAAQPYAAAQAQGHAQAQAQTAGQAQGAWHPDPTGRAEQRYWDGQAWTGHVVRGGQQAWDPI